MGESTETQNFRPFFLFESQIKAPTPGSLNPCVEDPNINLLKWDIIKCLLCLVNSDLAFQLVWFVFLLL